LASVSHNLNQPRSLFAPTAFDHVLAAPAPEANTGA
jgi:hypothetical protein